ncbi:protein phosphatase CheZ [Pandoraea thiooxydans]|nr:protein phosphatase CheZ [Pandoraea thiooxydans]
MNVSEDVTLHPPGEPDGGHVPSDHEQAERMLNRIGQLTRMLRDNLRELGLDKQIEQAAEAVPDARDRLNYVATMTEQAAERALNAIEAAKPIQQRLQQEASALDERWSQWFGGPLDMDDARRLVNDTRAYLRAVPDETRATNEQLMEIMLAQDFQDLTGQVIKKIMEVVRTIESHLLQVLLENVALDKRRESGEPLLNGPQINPEGRSDVVSDQAQVDDLLASLGF